jgi:hypothetical protein
MIYAMKSQQPAMNSLQPNVFATVPMLGDDLDCAATAVKIGFLLEPLLEALYRNSMALSRPVDVMAKSIHLSSVCYMYSTWISQTKHKMGKK